MRKNFRPDTQHATQLAFPFDILSLSGPVPRKDGVVYTRRWVVELMLDLAGYTPDIDLVNCLAIEPAAGQGAFLLPMIERLIISCKSHQHPLMTLASSLLAYEIDTARAIHARSAIISSLCQLGVKRSEAEELAHAWIHTGDYLLEDSQLPAADFVIGNPPYIRLEDINPALQTTYRAMYHTMQGRADLYIAFFEAALRGLKSGVDSNLWQNWESAREKQGLQDSDENLFLKARKHCRA